MSDTSDIKHLVQEAASIMNAIEWGNMFGAPPEDPEDAIRHETGGYLLTSLKRVLDIATMHLEVTELGDR